MLGECDTQAKLRGLSLPDISGGEIAQLVFPYRSIAQPYATKDLEAIKDQTHSIQEAVPLLISGECKQLLSENLMQLLNNQSQQDM